MKNARPPEVTSVLVRTVAKLLFLPILVTAVAMLIKGYAQPGDGFSAGVVGALGILLQYLSFGRRTAEHLPLVGLAGKGVFAGLLIAMLVAVVPVFLGQPVFTHYPLAGTSVVYLGTIELITAFLFDTAVFLMIMGFVLGGVQMISQTIADEDEYRGPDATGPEFDAGAGANAGVDVESSSGGGRR